MTKLVLATYGTECHLRMPGCTRVATTKDHLVPYSLGGHDVLENYRPACKRCNSKRGNRVISGYGARVVVVTGPPAAGKSTYIAEHASINDVTIDLDELARALMPIKPEGTHVYPDHVRDVAIGARAGAIERATRRAYGCTIWLIHAIPTPAQIADYQSLRWEVIAIDPGRDVVYPRCRELRPPYQLKHAERWYALYPNGLPQTRRLGVQVPQGAQPTPTPALSAASSEGTPTPDGWEPEW